jgi:hypothetical protein
MSAMSRHILPVLAALFLASAGSLQAAAQSEQEVQQENQRLRDEVARLEQELQSANERIDALTREIETLRAAGASGGGATPPAEERISIDETQPNASPRALLNGVKASYEEAVADLDIGDSNGSRERVAYVQAVERWSSSAEREFRSNVEWMVKVVEMREAGRNEIALRLQAIDPQYGTELGEPFVAALPRSRAQSLQEHGADATYQIRGTLVPNVMVDPTMESAAPFRESAFVGPFAEVTFSVDINTMLQHDFEDTTDADQPVDR